MVSLVGRSIALACMCLALIVTTATAAEFPYVLDPSLSLTGDCTLVPNQDEIADPGCPYPLPPAGPSGRFEAPPAVAIDAYGNEYIASTNEDGTTGRIDIFDAEGEFIAEIADPHGPKGLAIDSKGNLYVFEKLASAPSGGEVVRYSPTVYKPAQGEIAYGSTRVSIASDPSTLGSVAVDPSNDHLYISWWGIYMSEYESADDGNGLLATITPPDLLYNYFVAVDGVRRRLYASSCRDALFDCVVMVLNADAPHEVLEVIDGSTTPAGDFFSTNGKLGLAVDEESGHLLVGDLAASKNLYEFGESYEYLSKSEVPEAADSRARQIAISNSQLNPTAKNRRYAFVPTPKASGNVFAFEPPKAGPPAVGSVSATNIGERGAELRATVDPEGADTEYVIEYVSKAQFEVTEFDNAIVAETGILTGSQSQWVSVFINGLKPGTVYRFRVFAENELGNDEGQAGFATYSDASSSRVCINEGLRGGVSAALPDCRTYELVTPPDTNGNPTKGAGSVTAISMEQASPEGTKVSFQLLGGALPGTEATGGFHGDAYLASRDSKGWSTELAGPTGVQSSQPQPGGFSSDQGFNFWLAAGVGSALVNGEETRYIRYPDGRSELIGRGSEGTDPKAGGKLITKDATHVVFQTEASPQNLEPNAPPTGTRAVYDRTRDPITGAEETHVVSLLPGNVTPTAGQNGLYVGASADGNGIAFEIGSVLYLRVGNATTYEIATGVDFAGASEGGGRIFYVEGGDLLAYDIDDDETIEFTETGDAIPVNVAPDGSRAYFVSEETILGSGPNPNGAEPQANEQNLYLSEEGAISFVGTVTDRDVEGEDYGLGTIDGLGLWLEGLAKGRPGIEPSRLTPDGSVFLFQSRANLDGYDPGKDAPQIYRYEIGDDLECISCPPTETAPEKGAALQSFSFAGDPLAPFGPYGFVPSLRADGKRAFFESTEALVSSDTDGERDVYEWEADGVGSCNRAAGCIYLISSGHSESGDYLFGQSQSGDDVFFTTTDVLLPGDLTTLSVYDAKVDGGFPVSNPIICQGEACKPPPNPPPAMASPGKAATGVDDQVVKHFACPKGKRKVKRHGKFVCIKKKKHVKHKKKAKAGTSKKGGQR